MPGRPMPRVTVVDHPLVRHKLAFLRDSATDTKRFRELVAELATLLCYEATRELPLEPVTVRTPLEEAPGEILRGKKAAVVPIMRAGLGMVEGVTALLPAARVGFLGINREHDTLRAIEYYAKLPDGLAERTVLLVDPMLATGNSVVHALDLLEHGGARDIRLLVIVAAPEGIEAVYARHPDVPIFTAAIDRGLNDQGYIVPGLGDAGDRLFGTRPS